jgi:hypothetical protein
MVASHLNTSPDELWRLVLANLSSQGVAFDVKRDTSTEILARALTQFGVSASAKRMNFEELLAALATQQSGTTYSSRWSSIDQLLAVLAGANSPQIQLSNASFSAGAAQGTAIGTLSVTGGTGTWTFTLTDSASNKAQVAGTNGVNLQAGSSSASAGSFSVTVSATNGTTTINRTFLITAVSAMANYTATYISQGVF